MFIILFAILLISLILIEILLPIGTAILQYSTILYILCGAGTVIYSVYKGKQQKSFAFGFGVLLSLSQLLYFVLSLLLGIAETVTTEKDIVIAAFMVVLVGGLGTAYAVFNYCMVMNAIYEAPEHKWYVWVTGFVGWLVIIAISIL